MEIVLVEDNENLTRVIKGILKKQDATIVSYTNGLDAEGYILDNYDRISLIILDLLLPGKSGVEVCKTIRSYKIQTPVLMISALSSTQNKIEGLDFGADDYLIKPFELEELNARVSALLRRYPLYLNDQTEIGKGVFLDNSLKVIKTAKLNVKLTPTEYRILICLLKNKNRYVSKEILYDNCFDFSKVYESNTLEVHLKNLRKKLEFVIGRSIIKTTNNYGYILER